MKSAPTANNSPPLRLDVATGQRTDFVDITARVAAAVADCPQLAQGAAVTVFVPHTTAGVTINEHADPDVVTDIIGALDRLVPWRAGYRHGEGNSAAHIKATLTGSSVRIPLQAGRLALGTWQGIYLCEFDGPRRRQVVVSA